MVTSQSELGRLTAITEIPRKAYNKSLGITLQESRSISEQSFCLTKQDLSYMWLAWNISKESKCKKKKVGAVIVDRETNKIIATVYNGMNQPHECSLENHNSGNGCWHAEQIAILLAIERGQELTGKTIYVTDSPCRTCALMIILVGIKKVVYKRNHNDPLGIELLMRYDVEVVQVR